MEQIRSNEATGVPWMEAFDRAFEDVYANEQRLEEAIADGIEVGLDGRAISVRPREAVSFFALCAFGNVRPEDYNQQTYTSVSNSPRNIAAIVC
jgi:hypothetical protein